MKSYLQAIPRSFYDLSLYRTVIRYWRGHGALFLLTLAVVVSLLMASTIFYQISTIDESQVDRLIERIPVIAIKDGRATAAIDGVTDIPLIEKDNALILRIDLRDPAKQQGLLTDGMKNGILLQRHRLEFISNGIARNSYSLQRFGDTVIDQQRLHDTWKTLQYLPLILIPILIIGFWAGYMIQALSVSLITYLITAPMEVEYLFAERMRISAIAICPPLLINVMLTVMGIHSINSLTVLAIAALYAYVIIRTNTQNNMARN